VPDGVEPVFDPELPAEVREAYREDPEKFVPARRPKPSKVSELEAASLGDIAVLMVGGGLVVGLWLLIRWLSGALLPDLAATVVIVTAGIVAALMFIAVLVGGFFESDERKLAREHHGRYLLPEDFDLEATPLMSRAQEAVKAVLSAEVTKRGLLDDIEHEVVLPAQLWDLGLLLHRQSVLRARQRKVAGGINHPALESALGPQREALRKSTEVATQKVEALERLAERVRTADAALRVQDLIPTILGDSDKYLDLLASLGPAGDTNLIDDLGDDASTVTEILNRNIEDIRATSRELTVD
jgi:hypothetical protein